MSSSQTRTALEAVYGQSTPIPPFNFGIQDQDTRVLVSVDWDGEIHSTSIGGCIEAAFRLENELTNIYGQTLKSELLGPNMLFSGGRGSGLTQQETKVMRKRAVRALSGKIALSGASATIGAIIGVMIRGLLASREHLMLEAQSLENFVISELKSAGFQPDMQRAMEYNVDLIATNHSGDHTFVIEVKNRRLSFSDVARILAVSLHVNARAIRIIALSKSALEATPHSVSSYAAQNGVNVIWTRQLAKFLLGEDWVFN